MERTLIILKPSAIQRGLTGEIISRFEHKGLYFIGLKMMHLSDEILNDHYAHLAEKPFFKMLKLSMQVTPVIVACLEGIDAIQVVRSMCGTTNSRNAQPGTIRGDLSMSKEVNIIHTSDSPESAQKELNRFFKPEELFDYVPENIHFYYGDEELN